MKMKQVFISTTAAVLMAMLTGCGETTVITVQKWKNAGKIEKLIAVTTPESDQDIRFASIDALGSLKAEAAVEPLAALFTDDDFGVVLKSIEAMVKIGTPSAQNHLIEVFELKAPRGRAMAAEALGTYKTLNAVDALITVLDDEYEPAAIAAATSLGQIGDPKAIEALSAKIQLSPLPVRQACLQSLISIGGEDAIPGIALALGGPLDGLINHANPPSAVGPCTRRSCAVIPSVSVKKNVESSPTEPALSPCQRRFVANRPIFEPRGRLCCMRTTP